MNILLTGASGFIGSQLYQKLHYEGYKVIGISRKNKRYTICDITDLKALEKIVLKEKIDIIIHLAALIDSGNSGKEELYKINKIGTENLLIAGKKAKIKGFIYSSSMSVYDPADQIPIDEDSKIAPPNYYGESKMLGEKACAAFKNYFDIAILRYAGVFGAGKKQGAVYNFIKNAMQGKPIMLENAGSQTHDFVYIDDIVSATLLALKKLKKIKFDIFNIGSGKEYSVKYIAEKIVGISSSKSKIVTVEGPHSINQSRFLLSIKKAQNKLQYKPTTFDTAIKKMIKMLYENNSNN